MEIRVAGAADERHARSIYDEGEHEGRRFLVMEFLEKGNSLARSLCSKRLASKTSWC